jgi:hypothetical protein
LGEGSPFLGRGLFVSHMKKRRLPHAIKATDPAVFHKPPQAQSNVVLFHAALHGEPGD